MKGGRWLGVEKQGVFFLSFGTLEIERRSKGKKRGTRQDRIVRLSIDRTCRVTRRVESEACIFGFGV